MAKFSDDIRVDRYLIDKIVVSMFDFAFPCKDALTFQRLARKLIDCDLRRTSIGIAHAKFLFTRRSPFSGSVTLSRNRQMKQVRVSATITLNPTRLLRIQLQDSHHFGEAKSLDDRTNFLPLDLVCSLGIESIRSALLRAMQAHIKALYCILHKRIAIILEVRRRETSMQSFSTQYVEIYWDVPHLEPVDAVLQVRGEFEVLFRKSQCDDYESPPFSEQKTHHDVYLRGDVSSNEFHKIYAKTKERVRLESVYRKQSIRDLCGSTVFRPQSAKATSQMLDKLAVNAWALFSELTTKAESNDIERAALELLYDIVVCSGRGKAYEVARLPATHGGLSSTAEHRDVIYKLRDRGVPQKVQWGLYRLNHVGRGLIRRLYNFLQSTRRELDNDNGSIYPILFLANQNQYSKLVVYTHVTKCCIYCN